MGALEVFAIILWSVFATHNIEKELFYKDCGKKVMVCEQQAPKTPEAEIK